MECNPDRSAFGRRWVRMGSLLICFEKQTIRRARYSMFTVRRLRCFHHFTALPPSHDPALSLCRGRDRAEKGRGEEGWCGVGVKSFRGCLFALNISRTINIFNLGPSYYFSHHRAGEQSKVAHILALKRSIWQAHLHYAPLWRLGWVGGLRVGGIGRRPS